MAILTVGVRLQTFLSLWLLSTEISQPVESDDSDGCSARPPDLTFRGQYPSSVLPPRLLLHGHYSTAITQRLRCHSTCRPTAVFLVCSATTTVNGGRFPTVNGTRYCTDVLQRSYCTAVVVQCKHLRSRCWLALYLLFSLRCCEQEGESQIYFSAHKVLWNGKNRRDQPFLAFGFLSSYRTE